MPTSVLDAIRMGLWDYEPEEAKGGDLEPTTAMPGTNEKLEALARRIQNGLPLWHPNDCSDWEGFKSQSRV